MKAFSTSSLLLGACSLAVSRASPTCNYNAVQLQDYGTFSGTILEETLSGEPLHAKVDAWQGIRYSTPPTGESRFRPVDWPEPFNGTRPAIERGKACLQKDAARDPRDTQDEDCLNFNVYRPHGYGPDADLPVLVWIHSGAFNRRSSSGFDGAAFVANSPEPLIVITFNYRIGVLGFPSAPLFEEQGLLNLGLRDQRLFLRFVQKHIASFGGDPDSVTIGGLSAGAHSVGIHVFSNYGDYEGEQLFARAWLQSGSATARAFPNASYPLYEEQFAGFLELTGCDNAFAEGTEEVMACLREVSAETIRVASVTVFDQYDPQVTWPWQPVIGGPLLEKPGSTSGMDGTFYRVPVITSTTTDEGKNYVPGDIETNEEYLSFFKGIAPEMNDEDFELLEGLYADPATDPESPYTGSPNSTQYDRVSAAWSDYAYICPGQETAFRISQAGMPAWQLRWNTPNRTPEWQGVPHAADSRYAWAEPTVEFPEIGELYHAYLSSFVLSGDPNTYKLSGSPEWPRWEVERDGLGVEAAKQLVISPTGAEVETDDIRREQCLYWRDAERAVRLNK